MTDGLLVYGATGFTGKLIVDELLARGLRPVLGGRTRSKLERLARGEALDHRVAQLEDAGAVAAMLDGMNVVVNAAGPFRTTAPVLARACIQRGIHYLDITGEHVAMQLLHDLDADARSRRVMLLPGVGFDVVPTDCLAALVARRLPEAKSLSIALTGLDAISRGSAETVFDQYADLVMVRRGGQLTRTTPGELACDFDFGSGPRPTLAITWGDIASAYFTTGIPDITVYYDATPIVRLGLNLSRYGGSMARLPLWKWWKDAAVRMLPEGPDANERARGHASIVARVSDGHGRSAEARLHTPEVYSFTASTAAAVTDRVLGGNHPVGFQTPALAFGAEYVLSLPGVRYEELS